MSEPPPIDPRTKALLMSFRRALLMMVSAIEDYIGYSKQITTQ